MAEPTTLPTTTQTVDQRFLIERLGGDREPVYYLDRFPSEVYNTSIDSHLVKFLYSMLGPAGIGEVRRNFLEARLMYEAHGLELYDLDRFYGNPFQFGRIAEEVYTEDVRGLLPQDEWEKIRAKDARYRNRVIDFFSGARAGGTPLGMRLVARSGLGHEVEVVENYKSLFDQNSDDPLGTPYVGKTRFLNEFIVLPRQEVSRSEVQRITVLGSPTGGTFRLAQSGSPRTTEPIPYNATRQAIETALLDAYQVAPGNIDVQGGPLPSVPVNVRFVGDLEAQNLTQMETSSEMTGGENPRVLITTSQQGFDGTQEIAHIPPRDQHNLQTALDRIRPVNSIPTFGTASGTQSRINWVRAGASSEFDEMIRYVTGNGLVQWPERDNFHWIEAGVEHQALRTNGDLPYNYRFFHEATATSYTQDAFDAPEYLTPSWAALSPRFASNHVGPYNPYHAALFPFLRNIGVDQVMTADRIFADYAEPLHVSRVVDVPGGTVGLINGIYPTDYQSLPGAPNLRYGGIEQFWSSREDVDGTEYIELDLGVVKAVNYLSFELTRKPLDLAIDYDVTGMETGERDWRPVEYPPQFTNPRQSSFNPTDMNPWQSFEYFFTNRRGEMIYTRFVRIKFSRRTQSDFLTNVPWSVDVRNLRIGRNVANQ